MEPLLADANTNKNEHVLPAPTHAAEETQPATIKTSPVISATPAPPPVTQVAPPPVQAPQTPQGGTPAVANIEPPKQAPPQAAAENKVETHTPAATPVAVGMFRTAEGNDIAETSEDEAKVLNAIRGFNARIDPTWLRNVQSSNGVKDATGAMNTETLRMMRGKLGAAALTADAIVHEAFLKSLVTDLKLKETSPFFGTTEVGFRTPDKYKHAAAGASTPKDRAVQEHHFASYADYQSSWTNIVLLGKTLGTGHPFLANRVAAADAYLRGRFPDIKEPEAKDAKDKKKKDKEHDHALRDAAHWNGEGNASYADDIAKFPNATHQHAMGLAIDIDPGQNAYMFDHHVEGKTADESQWFVNIFTETFEVASKLYGTPAISESTLFEWSARMSTEELLPKVEAASEGFKRLLAMSRRGNAKEIRSALAEHYKGTELDNHIKTITNIDTWFHLQSGRAEALGPTNLKMEMVIALRDVAGLAWGGTEMDAHENADFMHFDCRQTNFGQQIYQSGLANHG